MRKGKKRKNQEEDKMHQIHKIAHTYYLPASPFKIIDFRASAARPCLIFT